MLPDFLRVVAELLFQAHHQVELLFALHHLRRGRPADGRLDQAVDVGDVQAVAGDLGAVDVHGQARLAEFLDQRDVFDPAHAFQDVLDRLAFGFQRLQVRPEDLDRQRAFQAGFGFIHGVFGRLRVVEDDAGKRLELLVDGLDQLRLGAIRPLPFAVGLEPDEEFHVEKAGGVRAVVRPAMLGGDDGDFGEGAENLADLRRDLARFLERDGVGHGGANPERAFVQVRHELGADRGNEQQRAAEHQHGRQRGGPGMREAEIETFGVGGFDGFEAGVAPLAHAFAEGPRTKHRQQGQRDDQRADQREDHRVGHRREEFARRPRENVDRQEARDDHRDGVEDRAVHFGGGVRDDFHDLERLAVARGDLAEDVLHHHHRAVHQDAKVHRADGKQVGRDVVQVEADEGEQQRQRNGGGDNQAGANVVEEEDQHDHDEDHAAEQISLDGLRGQRNQVAPVVEGMDLDVLGQDVPVEVLRSLLQRACSTSWVFSPVRIRMTPSTASSWSW